MNQTPIHLETPSNLWSALNQSQDADAFYHAWMQLMVEHIENIQEAILVMGPANAGPFRPVASWPFKNRNDEQLAQICEQALEMRTLVTRNVSGLTIVAIPIQNSVDVFGVIGIVLEHTESIDIVHQWVNWGAGWLLSSEQGSEGNSELSERLMVFLDLMMSAIDEQESHAACQTVVTKCAVKMNCDRVSLGFGNGDLIKLVAISGSAEFAKQIDLVHSLESVMNETADQGEPIVIGNNEVAEDEETGAIQIKREHEKFQKQYGNQKILSVPFFFKAEQYGVFVFEWPIYEVDPLAERIALGAPPILGRLLLEKKESQLPFYKVVFKSIKGFMRRLFGPRHTLFKLMFSLLILLAIFLSVAKGDFRVSADAVLEGGVRRFIVAPYEGYVASALVRAGQMVKQGQVIATLDDRDLKLELSRWHSERLQYIQQSHDAEADRDLAQVQIAQAQSKQAAAQLELTETMLERASIIAPFDGLLVSGDLSQHLGSVIQKGQNLFEITPLDSYRVILNVGEKDIAHITEGQTGQLVLAALSDAEYSFTVSLVTPVAHAEDGTNYFRIEATLDETAAPLRPGMEGIGKISISERYLVWIWTHHMTDYLRLKA